jgi:hypothetical protein
MEERGTMKFQFDLTAEQLATVHVALEIYAMEYPGTSTETKTRELIEFMSHNFNVVRENS